ncbi:hypothetical protein TWF569_001022 [Orbilia oligospora]|uniref:Altered inheritance rate of mitochondria protein 29 n=1 Tax=Orbilia oligospora TaxID=2813651 RepID=A0A7C8NK29_ORBOL|nr:hypothetical protein TWF102_010603 [Orbilia oligospora]KAF3093097.1 hypothetical protein TWF103_011058 [Orbilia oligospora]KAF3102229.1 hypothetical protein TWF706_005374 [Orbilia oligospora]KAF3125249.1 hypothetical protein TWF569_001022 [Orbilia oligospora]KAF3134613.1 hypothetical protein TWF703_006270 [Orbilia oligospora]
MSSTSSDHNDSLKTATITVRVIKSFPYRTCKNLVVRGLDLTTITIGEFKARAVNDVKTLPGWKPYQNVELDSMKLYTKAHGTKTQNLIINLDRPDWMFDDDSKTLAEVGCEHETEVSFFNRTAYDEYLADPVNKWD